MKIKLLILSVLFICFSCGGNEEQKNNRVKSGDRVQNAHHEKWADLKKSIEKLGIDSENYSVFLRAFKEEQILEVWIKNNTAFKYHRLLTYPFCATSGVLGPKKKEGDLQIPEGFYEIGVMNPKSKFHLSMEVNYPNAHDQYYSDPKHPGGDIYIHGDCVTVGCIPITDDKIKSLYTLVKRSRDQGNTKIPVHIFPNHLTSTNLSRINKSAPQHAHFWTNLSEGYAYFEKENKLPKISINNKRYTFK